MNLQRNGSIIMTINQEAAPLSPRLENLVAHSSSSSSSSPSSSNNNKDDEPVVRRRRARHALFSSSMPRLNFSPIKGGNNLRASAILGNDSMSKLKLNFSLINLEDDDDDDNKVDDHQKETQDLLDEINHAMLEQSNRKIFMDQLLHANLRMAKARYSSGSEFGAVLSMRKYFKDKTHKAYLAAAHVRLNALRAKVKQQSNDDENQQPHYLNNTVQQHRRTLQTILAELKSATCPMPSNEDLLQQLQSLMMAEV